MSKEFKIKRTNLTEIKRLKEEIKKLKADTPTIEEPKESTPTPTTPTATVDTDEAEASAKAKPKSKSKSKSTGKGQTKRQPLDTEQAAFLKDYYYNKSGFTGRDVLYKQLQVYYKKHDTPEEERISRRRMWNWLKKQSVNQLHRALPATSETIKPVNAMYKLDRVMVDLIIRGGDAASKWVGIMSVVDVATRKAWTELLPDKTSKTVAAAFERVAERAYESLPEKDKKLKLANSKNGKSKTWEVLMTDNGGEFEGAFATMAKKLNMKLLYGVPNVSTSQSHVERFNGTLQLAMEKERTSTGARWFDLVEDHTAFYNKKTNRNLRLRPEDDEDAPYVYYTPNMLWDGDRDTLTRLYEEKNADLKQGDHLFGAEKEVKVGQHVRLALLDKRKAALSKGHTPNWSAVVYEVYKIKRPKSAISSLPLKFYVKTVDDGEIKKHKGNAVAYTIKDIQLISDEVMKAPAETVVVEKAGVSTRSKKEEKEEDDDEAADDEEAKEPTPPKAKAKAKNTKAPVADDPLIGKSIVGNFNSDADKELKVKGKIVKRQKRSKTLYYQVAWGNQHKDKYDYNETQYFKKAKIKQMLDQT